MIDVSDELGSAKQKGVGLVADNAASMLQLRNLISSIGQTVTYALTPEQTLESKPLMPSLWLVVSEQADDVFEALCEWSDSPIFVAEDMPNEEQKLAFKQWWQRMQLKLSDALECAPFEQNSIHPSPESLRPKFKEVWVLAASLGGPEAVRVFLQHLQPKLPVAFIYAQHIEPNFDKMLPAVVGKNSELDVVFCEEHESLKPSSVMVLPSHQYAEIYAGAKVKVHHDQFWQQPYTPNIDQIIENVALFYADKMGVIIFSGMCDDGAKASLALKQKGMPIWAQTPEECICPAMPEAVISSGQVDVIAGAKALAEQFNKKFAVVE